MAKAKPVFFCNECGATSSKWAGQCADCGAWNSIVESKFDKPSGGKSNRGGGYAGSRSEVQKLSEISAGEEIKTPTGLSELDRVLGGGLVSGAVILIGGDPGIGKSTLLLQTVAQLNGTEALYVTGEESPRQVRMRADRMGLNGDSISLLAETCVEDILIAAEKTKPAVMVVDSMQTVYTDGIQSAPGSVSQIRESAAQLVRYAKNSGCTLFLVGHVTKEGTLAGPRVLEHMVDTVLYFESDHGSRYRLIRAVKNRFGAVNELGVFAMMDQGLREVSNPSAIFLSQRDDHANGSSVLVTWEGSRPLLVELQVLVDSTGFGNPRRVTLGLDHNRLAMLLAVLHRHGGIALGDQDVFVNVVGGVRITETASDLPLLLAAISSLRNRAVDSKWISFGEVGLSGEIRPVQNGLERLKEAVKHGFTHAIVPAQNAPSKGQPIAGLTVYPVRRVNEAIELLP